MAISEIHSKREPFGEIISRIRDTEKKVEEDIRKAKEDAISRIGGAKESRAEIIKKAVIDAENKINKKLAAEKTVAEKNAEKIISASTKDKERLKERMKKNFDKAVKITIEEIIG